MGGVVDLIGIADLFEFSEVANEFTNYGFVALDGTDGDHLANASGIAHEFGVVGVETQSWDKFSVGEEDGLVEFGFVKEDCAAKFCTLAESAATEGCDRIESSLRPVAGLAKFCISCVEATEEEGVGEVGGSEEFGIVQPQGTT